MGVFWFWRVCLVLVLLLVVIYGPWCCFERMVLSTILGLILI